MRDYVNKRQYVTSKARVAAQRHLAINLDLSNPHCLHLKPISSNMISAEHITSFKKESINNKENKVLLQIILLTEIKPLHRIGFPKPNMIISWI